MSTTSGRGVAVVFCFAGLVAASCNADLGSTAGQTTLDAGASSLGSPPILESAGAGTRIAELRARFRIPAVDQGGRQGTQPALGAPVATRFDKVGSAASARIEAVIPAESLRGVTRAARVTLPMSATDQVTLEDATSHLSVRFALENVQGAGIEVSGGIAFYRGALGGADVVHRVHAEGTEDFVVFEERPTREVVSYLVDVSRIAGLRLVSNTLEFMDESGTPQLRISPPYVVDAKGKSHEAKLAVDDCAYDTSPAGPWRRAVTRPGATRCTVHVAWAAGLAYPLLVDPAWGTTGSLATARSTHTASVLASGRVLIAGGQNAAVLTSAELYDPAGNAGTGTFAATGAMAAARCYHVASVLPSGKVLVAGGQNIATAELYDPGTGQFASTGSMTIRRESATASLLPTGKVLVIAGLNGVASQASAELFDPAGNGGAGSFTATGSLARSRYSHTASVLRNGKVLVAGGKTPSAALATAEVWDSVTGTFVATGLMATPRGSHTASVLGSGKVLVVGGSSSSANNEIYDPVAGTFAATGALLIPREGPATTVLASGKVLVAGGFSAGVSVATAELFDPAGNGGAGTFAASGSMATARLRHTASVLATGKVLIVGGESGGAYTASAEVFGGAIGETCVGNGACLSGFCADGVCCNSACSGGACDRCDLPGKQGTCSVAPQGNPGANPACVGYVCDGTSVTCPTSCTGDSSCGAEFYCAPDRTCQPRKALAAACSPQMNCKEPGCRECASGSCADGVCCDTACTGSCQACVAALKQNAVGDGTCGPIRGGTDPSNECAPSTTVCAADGQCDGAGACRTLTPASVSCGPDGKVCDGKGTCVLPTADTCDGANTVRKVDGTTVDCSPYKCNSNGTCRAECTSVSDCTGETICDSSGKCVPPTPAPGPDTADSGGCSASPSAPAGGAALPLVLLGSMAALASRRRRRLQ